MMGPEEKELVGVRGFEPPTTCTAPHEGAPHMVYSPTANIQTKDPDGIVGVCFSIRCVCLVWLSWCYTKTILHNIIWIFTR